MASQTHLVTIITLEVTHEKAIPDLPDLVAGRSYNLQNVVNCTVKGIQEHVGNPTEEPEKITHKLNSDMTVAVATEVYWEDVATCPRGAKVQLLTVGGVAIYGNYRGEAFYTAWAPVPRKRVEDKNLPEWVLTSPTGQVFKGTTKYDCMLSAGEPNTLV